MMCERRARTTRMSFDFVQAEAFTELKKLRDENEDFAKHVEFIYRGNDCRGDLEVQFYQEYKGERVEDMQTVLDIVRKYV